MCLESRIAALLVALFSVVPGGGDSTPPGDGRPTAPIDLLPTPQISHDPRSTGGVQIRGRLLTPDHEPLANGTVVIAPEDSDGSTSSIDGHLAPNGTFVFSNVPPGTYLIRALAQLRPNEPALFALFRVTVRGSAVDAIELVLRPGATISGQIIIEPGSSVGPSTGSGRPEPAEGRNPRSGDNTARGTSLMDALPGVRVRAPSSDGGSFDDAPQTGHPARDGTFAVEGVIAGTHVLVLEGLPIPWVVKNVTYRGQDITDTGLQADSGQRLGDVSITVTDRASEVSGTVRDGEGRVVPDARVLFVPVPAGLWPLASRRYARAIADRSGHYSVRGLPAGDYKVTAALEIADRDLYRRDILRDVRDLGHAFSLQNDQARVVDLSVTHLPLQHRVVAHRVVAPRTGCDTESESGERAPAYAKAPARSRRSASREGGRE